MKYILILLLSTQAHAFSWKPEPTEPPKPVPVPTLKELTPRWANHSRGKEYTKLTQDALAKHMKYPFTRAKDASSFCGKEVANAWVYLISHIAELESSFKADTTYRESFKNSKGEYVVSVGLLQVSYESMRGYGCKDATTEKLKDPAYNLDCGIRAFAKLLERDELLSKKVGSKWLGPSAYWAVLRSPKVETIKKNMLEACK